MSANSKIEWTDHTFNPWIGCTKVSPGCLNCYAEARDRRHLIEKVDHWGKGAPRLRTSAANWRQPLKWNRTGICSKCGVVCNLRGDLPAMAHAHASETCTGTLRSPRVFCASLADVFDDEVPIDWLADLPALIHATPNLDWLLLTKRPENWRERLHEIERERLLAGHATEFDDWLGEWVEGNAPYNVWIGTSVEDQTRADERIPELLQIPARIRFLSCEPLLGPVDVIAETLAGQIHWIIVGGESGPEARPCEVRWSISLVKQCKAAGVPVFVKQLGANIVDRNDAGFDGESPREWPMDTDTRDIDSGYQGAPVRVLLRNPKGGDMSEWPEVLRVRRFPQPSVPSVSSV